MRTTCPWYIRWWHRRLRKLDERLMFRSIDLVAQGRRLRPREVRRAFVTHMASSKHWCCPCSLEYGQEDPGDHT